MAVSCKCLICIIMSNVILAVFVLVGGTEGGGVGTPLLLIFLKF